MVNNYNFHNDFFSIIILVGIIQGIVLSFFFLARRNKLNQYLGILLFLFALHNLDFWASYSFLTLKMPFFLDISVPFTFLMGPLLFHYIYNLLKNKSDKYLIYHYIPFILLFIHSLFFIIQPDEFKYNVYISSREIVLPLKEAILKYPIDPLGIRNWFGVFISLQLSIYLTLGYLLFIKHIQYNNINIIRTNLPVIKWLRNLLMAATLIIILSVVILIFYPGGQIEYVLAISFTFFIYYISFNLIRGSSFFELTLYPDKYVKSSLTGQMKSEYRRKLEQIMKTDKPYLNNLFSIKKLSHQTGIPLNHLSQVLNEEIRLSFFEYTRLYRINEAQKLLTDPTNLNTNIEEIAYRVGYNSKSAFNKAFLLLTGQTPLSFKKKNML